jgi:Large polyvalent protein associated domain 38
MPSLTTCLKKAGTFIDAQDKAAILGRVRELRASGLSAGEAATQAVDERLQAVQMDLDAVDGVAFQRGDQTQTPEFKAWFGIDDGQGPADPDVQRVTEIQRAITAGWANAPEVVVLSGMDDPAAPEIARQQDATQRAQGATGAPRAFHYQGKVYLIASELPTQDVASAIFHEALGHYGFRGVFGEALGPLLDQMAGLNGAAVAAKAREYGLDITDQAQRRMAAEEVLAELAETRPQSTWVQRALAAIKAWLRKYTPFLDYEPLSDAELIRMFIAPARGFVERGTGARSEPPGNEKVRFQRRPQDPLTEARRKAGLSSKSGTARSALDSIGRAFSNGLRIVREANLRSELLWEARQGGLDQFAGALRVERQTFGQMLPAEQSPYVAMRLANGGTSSVMRALMMHGQAKWAANGQHLEKMDGTAGLLDILQPLGKDLDDWFGWMIGNRAERLMTEGRENNFTAEDIKALKALGENTEADPGRRARFVAVAQKYAAFKRSVLDVAEGAGLIDAEARAVWDKSDYIPFYRVMDESEMGVAGGQRPTGKRGLSGQSSGIRTLTGGDSALGDPMENLLMNFSRLIDASLKNNALLKVVDKYAGETGPLQKIGYDMSRASVPAAEVRKHLVNNGTPEAIMSAVPDSVFDGMAKMWSIQAPADPDVIRVMRNGKPEFYRVDDPLLLRSLTSFVPFDFPGLGLARAFKRVLTATVTATPEFMLRNFIRDAVSSAMISRDGWSPVDAAKGIRDSWKVSPLTEAAMFSGSSFQSGSVNAADPTQTANAMRRALRAKGFDASSADAFVSSIVDKGWRGWELYREAGEALENANRSAVARSVADRGGSPTEALYEYKDLMDFNLRGSWAVYQVLADTVPFLNARVQGLYRLGRADPARVVKYGMVMAMASVALAMMNAGQDWYEELADWDKDTYWHFKVGGQHFRLPKPFELGVIFATMPERLFRAIQGYDSWKKFGSRSYANVRDQLKVDPVPQILNPLVDAWRNKDTFTDRPIETLGDLNKRPNARFDQNTSPTTTAIVSAAPGVADFVGLSPKKLEFLVQGYFGAIGSYALGLADLAVREATDAPPRPALRADDLPVVKAFYRADPARGTVFESDLYALRDEANKIYAEFKQAQKDASSSGDESKVEALVEQERENLEAYRPLNAGANRMAKIRKERNAILADRTMSPEEKRKRIDELQAQTNAVAKAVMQTPEVSKLR